VIPLLLAAAFLLLSPVDLEADRIKAKALLGHVDALCAETIKGRMALNPGAREAAGYVASAFEQAGLKPAHPGEDPAEAGGFILELDVSIDVMDKDITPEGEDRVYEMSLGGSRQETCPLVLGRIEGRDREWKDEIVLVIARCDGQGWDGTNAVFQGAGRNASGVAAMIELARVLAERRSGIRRTVLFAALPAGETGEFMRRNKEGAEYERLNHLVVRYLVESGEWDEFLLSDLVRMPGLAGADAFITDPPVPLDRIHAVVDLNMLGGNLVLDADREEEPGFVTGTAVVGGETGEGLAKTLERACNGADGRAVFLTFAEIRERGLKRVTESVAFMKKRIPSVWITTGPREEHGTAADDPAAIVPEQLESAARLAYLVVRTLANESDSHPFPDAGR
jgi:hypothetical protein